MTSKTTIRNTRELSEDELALVSGGTPSATKSSPAPKISESISLPYGGVVFAYTPQRAD